MAQRENQRVVISKRLLKEGLLRLLETEKLEKVTVTDLCRESGINRATFYRHYVCPRDVLVELEQDMIHGAEKMLKKPTSHQEALHYLAVICTFLYERRDLVCTLIRCKTDEELVQILREYNQRAWELRDELKQAEQMDLDSTRLVSTFLYSGGYYMIRQWLTEDIRKSPMEMAQLIYKMIFRQEPPEKL